MASDEFRERSDNAVFVSTSSIHVSCGRGFVTDGHGHVLFFVFLRTEVALLLVAANFFAGFAALQWHSPDKKIYRVHVVVAFSLLVADVTYFVDQPNFVLPARSISRNVLQ